MTTYSAAISSVVVCLSVSSVLAISFFLVFCFAVIQIGRMWADGSKLSHRKRVFIRLIACNLTRCLWYTMSSYHLLPENFDETFVSVQDGILFPFLMEQFSYATWRSLSHFAYLWPTALLFTAASWTVLNWFQLYQREKLLKKMAPGIRSSKLTPLERRKKSEYKQKKLYYFQLVISTIIHSTALGLAPLSLHKDQIADLPRPWHYFLFVLNPEVVLALVCFLGLVAVSIYAFRILGNMKLALKSQSDSEKLTMQSSFVLIVIVALLIYYISVVFSQMCSSLLSLDSDVIHAHVIIRAFEILFNIVILFILALPSLSLRAPFPSKAREITQDWLTSVLRDKGIIKSTTTVVAFSCESLYGGCHFKVARVHLTYSVEKPDDPHKTVIVKLLQWDKPLHERILLYLKYSMGSLDKEAMYLTSYRIESLFYKQSLSIVRGFHTAKVYYNLEDVFNNRFGMVLQDLSQHPDGQPGGFTYDQSKLILASLAEFHAVNKGKKMKQFGGDGWKRAGYWTGTKREAVKSSVDSSWERVMINFPDLHFRERYPCFGGLMKDKLLYVEQEFDLLSAKRYRTLCHGDFKISNLFVANPSKENPEGKLYVIDFQWFGYGNGLIDALYFLYTSLRAEDLDSLNELLDFYYEQLLANGWPEYEKDVFDHHANVVLVDFAFYVVTSKYSVMTPTDFKQYELKVKDGLHLRSVPHMERILKDAHRLVCHWSKRPSQLSIDRKVLH